MVTFAEVWAEITDLLKAKAAGLGVPEDQIVQGFEGMIGAAPFLYVYLMPENNVTSESGRHMIAKAEVMILCGVEGGENKTDALIECSKLMGRVATAMKSSNAVIANPPITILSNSAEKTIVALNYTVPYNHYQPLLEA